MNAETLLIVFVGVTALAVVVQGFFAWRLLHSSRKLIGQITHSSQELESEAREIAGQLQDVANSLSSLKNISEAIQARTEEIDRMFQERTADVDELITKLVNLGGLQAEKIDEVVSDTVTKFEQTTELIQQDILKPVVEISSLVKGFRQGLEFLFGKNKKQEDQDLKRDDLFI
ncbi:MAG: hypothetical protein ABIJ42_09955 [Acidobacteriota bacterium]